MKIVRDKNGVKVLRKDSDIRRGDKVLATLDSDGTVIPVKEEDN